jgi:hypothetical protein
MEWASKVSTSLAKSASERVIGALHRRGGQAVAIAYSESRGSKKGKRVLQVREPADHFPAH